jgi:hypothetical protein
MAASLDAPRMDGWKAIARYLGRDRTTAMRWVATRGLPVHRLPGGERSSVYAITAELDAWMLGNPDRPDAGGPARDFDPGRRTIVLGALAAAAAGGLAIALRRPGDRSGEVDALLDQARVLRSQNTRETQNQAIGLAREAVKLAPRDADAWGALGYARATASHWRDEDESRLLREQATLDGQHALDLDPGNAKGELALASALPLLGQDNWLARAARLERSLARSPADPDALTESAWILRFTGQCAQAAAACRKVDPRYHGPPLFNIWVRSLWSTGALAERDRKLAEALERYPTNKMLWSTRLEMMIYDGHADEAAGDARDVHNRPGAVSEREAEEFATLALTVRNADRARNDAFMQTMLERAARGVRMAINAMRFASVTGRLDRAFSLADAYYFGRGFSVGDDVGNGMVVPLNQRHTNFLFEPPLAAMRADRRFAELADRLGLERYWREIGRRPDYRRLASSAPRRS